MITLAIAVAAAAAGWFGRQAYGKYVTGTTVTTKLSVVKDEVSKIEQEVVADFAKLTPEVRSFAQNFIIRLKALL